MIGLIGVLGFLTLLFYLAVSFSKAENSNFTLVTEPSAQQEKVPRFSEMTSAQEANQEEPEKALPQASMNESVKVSINQASQEELESLPLIGEKKALQIQMGRPYASMSEFFTKNKISPSQQSRLQKLLKM